MTEVAYFAQVEFLLLYYPHKAVTAQGFVPVNKSAVDQD